VDMEDVSKIINKNNIWNVIPFYWNYYLHLQPTP
jgi:hypothetical protein